MVLSRFGLKTGIDFAHFGLESGMVFTTTVCGRIHSFNFKSVRKKNMRSLNDLNGFEEFFCFHCYLRICERV